MGWALEVSSALHMKRVAAVSKSLTSDSFSYRSQGGLVIAVYVTGKA